MSGQGGQPESSRQAAKTAGNTTDRPLSQASVYSSQTESEKHPSHRQTNPATWPTITAENLREEIGHMNRVLSKDISEHLQKRMAALQNPVDSNAMTFEPQARRRFTSKTLEPLSDKFGLIKQRMERTAGSTDLKALLKNNTSKLQLWKALCIQMQICYGSLHFIVGQDLPESNSISSRLVTPSGWKIFIKIVALGVPDIREALTKAEETQKTSFLRPHKDTLEHFVAYAKQPVRTLDEELEEFKPEKGDPSAQWRSKSWTKQSEVIKHEKTFVTRITQILDWVEKHPEHEDPAFSNFCRELNKLHTDIDWLHNGVEHSWRFETKSGLWDKEDWEEKVMEPMKDARKKAAAAAPR